MNYEETIEYIEGLAVFGSMPGFERINALLDELDHPEKKLKYVHVAGTNGKGSVCTETANILTESGYKTGLFTSPFVSDFRERIQIDGKFIPKDKLCEITERVKKSVDRIAEKGIQPTEFEVITAIAFIYYSEELCDVVVLEVGLGGLLDSTNIIEAPLVSVIVSLSFDHMGVLGNSIEEIAEQKAGIIKENGVTVCAPQKSDSAFKVIENTAALKHNKFTVADPSVIQSVSESIDGHKVTYKNLTMNLPLLGDHQLENLSVTMSIIDELRELGYNISESAVTSGIEKTAIPARVEVLSKTPLVILDGGHNDDGAAALASTLKEYVSDKKILLVIGVMADKEVDKVIEHLAPLASTIIATTPQNPRALSAIELCQKTSVFCKDSRPEADPCKAFDLALEFSDADSAVVVCGSLYLAGDVRLHMMETLSAH